MTCIQSIQAEFHQFSPIFGAKTIIFVNSNDFSQKLINFYDYRSKFVEFLHRCQEHLILPDLISKSDKTLPKSRISPGNRFRDETIR